MNNRFFYFHQDDGVFWFRLFGHGLSFVNRKKHKELFSQRYGYTKTLRIGGWSVQSLRRCSDDS